jgi:hypothetical protein
MFCLELRNASTVIGNSSMRKSIDRYKEAKGSYIPPPYYDMHRHAMRL